MNFTLNIYEKKQVVKTYECDAYDLMFGTMEDFLEILDLDAVDTVSSDMDFAKIAVSMITKSLGKLKPLLMDVFDGLTEEELRKTKIKELISVILQILKHSVAEIKGVAITDLKNV